MFEGVADVRWQDQGACLRLEDASVMFPSGTVDSVAVRTCAICPVRSQCRQWFDQVEDVQPRHMLTGYVGGETVVQRVERRKRDRAADEIEARHLRVLPAPIRCEEHPAYEPDYCPLCGTAAVIGR